MAAEFMLDVSTINTCAIDTCNSYGISLTQLQRELKSVKEKELKFVIQVDYDKNNNVDRTKVTAVCTLLDTAGFKCSHRHASRAAFDYQDKKWREFKTIVSNSGVLIKRTLLLKFANLSFQYLEDEGSGPSTESNPKEKDMTKVISAPAVSIGLPSIMKGCPNKVWLGLNGRKFTADNLMNSSEQKAFMHYQYLAFGGTGCATESIFVNIASKRMKTMPSCIVKMIKYVVFLKTAEDCIKVRDETLQKGFMLVEVAGLRLGFKPEKSRWEEFKHIVTHIGVTVLHIIIVASVGLRFTYPYVRETWYGLNMFYLEEIQTRNVSITQNIDTVYVDSSKTSYVVETTIIEMDHKDKHSSKCSITIQNSTLIPSKYRGDETFTSNKSLDNYIKSVFD